MNPFYMHNDMVAIVFCDLFHFVPGKTILNFRLVLKMVSLRRGILWIVLYVPSYWWW